MPWGPPHGVSPTHVGMDRHRRRGLPLQKHHLRTQVRTNREHHMTILLPTTRTPNLINSALALRALTALLAVHTVNAYLTRRTHMTTTTRKTTESNKSGLPADS